MKSIFKYLTRLDEVLLLLSPFIITSLFLGNSSYSPLFVSVMSINLIGLVLLASFAVKSFTGKVSNFAAGTVFVSVLLTVGMSLFQKGDNFFFNLFGNGVGAFPNIHVIYFGLMIALLSQARKVTLKAFAISSAVVLLYTLINYGIYNFGWESIFAYTKYINLPMLNHGALVNPASVYTFILLISSLVLMLLSKRLSKLSQPSSLNSTAFKVFALLLVALELYFAIYLVRNIAAERNYSYALNAANTGDRILTDEYLDKSIKYYPTDIAYLAKIDLKELTRREILNKKIDETNRDAIAEEYVTNVQSQIDLAKKAVSFNKYNPTNHLALALTYERAYIVDPKAYELATEEYNTAASYALTDKEVPSLLKTKLALSLEKKEDAQKFLDEATSIAPESYNTLYFSTQYYAALGDKEKTKSFAERLLALYPEDVEANRQMGIIYYEEGNYKSSVPLLDKAYATNKDDISAYLLTKALVNLGEKDTAKAVFEATLGQVYKDSDVDVIKKLKEELYN